MPAAAVAGALARRSASRGDVGAQLERGLEAVLGRVVLEGVEPVDRDAAAHEVEMGGGSRRVAALLAAWAIARDGAPAAVAPRRVKRSSWSPK